MIKMIIVDDEPYVCDLLTEILKWDELGYTISGVFYTAQSALDFLESNPVDVVFTDIKMPDMSGIEIASICRDKYPHIKFVFISAHRDFNYAHQAIQLQATDYIVKPIVYDQLYQSAVSVKEIIEKEKNAAPNFIDTELSLYRQQFFCDFISDIAHDETNFEYIFNRMKIDISTLECQCAIIELKINDFENKVLNKWNYPNEVIYTAIRQMLPHETEKYYLVQISKMYNRVEFLMLLKEQKLDLDLIFADFSKTYNAEFFEYIGSDVQFSIKKQTMRLRDLHGIMSLKQITSKKVESIFSQLICGDTEEAKINIESVFKIYNEDFSELIYFCKELIKRLNESNITLPEKLENINKLNPNTLKQFMDKYIILCKNKSAETNKITNDIILKAVEYIKENYNKEISLEDVASHVALNPRYFCSYFKKNTGESFIDYLIKIRIENAKKIIEENKDLKISHLYEYVGYKSAPYFYKVFQSYTGMTPSEYKKSLTEKNYG